MAVRIWISVCHSTVSAVVSYPLRKVVEEEQQSSEGRYHVHQHVQYDGRRRECSGFVKDRTVARNRAVVSKR